MAQSYAPPGLQGPSVNAKVYNVSAHFNDQALTLPISRARLALSEAGWKVSQRVTALRRAVRSVGGIKWWQAIITAPVREEAVRTMLFFLIWNNHHALLQGLFIGVTLIYLWRHYPANRAEYIAKYRSLHDGLSPLEWQIRIGTLAIPFLTTAFSVISFAVGGSALSLLLRHSLAHSVAGAVSLFTLATPGAVVPKGSQPLPLTTDQLRSVFERIAELAGAPITPENGILNVQIAPGRHMSFDGTTLQLYTFLNYPKTGYGISPEQFNAKELNIKTPFIYSGGAPLIAAGVHRNGHIVLFGAEALFSAHESFQRQDPTSADVLSGANPGEIDIRKPSDLSWAARDILHWLIPPRDIPIQVEESPAVADLPSLDPKQLRAAFDKISALAEAPITQEDGILKVQIEAGRFMSFDGKTLQLYTFLNHPRTGYGISADQFTAQDLNIKTPFIYSGGAPLVAAGINRSGSIELFCAEALLHAHEQFQRQHPFIWDVLSHANPSHIDIKKANELSGAASHIIHWLIPPRGIKIVSEEAPHVEGLPSLLPQQLATMFDGIIPHAKGSVTTDGNTRIAEYDTGHYVSFDGTTLQFYVFKNYPKTGFGIGTRQFTAQDLNIKTPFIYSGGAPLVAAGINTSGKIVIFGAEGLFPAHEWFQRQHPFLFNVLSHAQPGHVEFRKPSDLTRETRHITHWLIKPPDLIEASIVQEQGSVSAFPKWAAGILRIQRSDLDPIATHGIAVQKDRNISIPASWWRRHSFLRRLGWVGFNLTVAVSLAKGILQMPGVAPLGLMNEGLLYSFIVVVVTITTLLVLGTFEAIDKKDWSFEKVGGYWPVLTFVSAVGSFLYFVPMYLLDRIGWPFALSVGYIAVTALLSTIVFQMIAKPALGARITGKWKRGALALVAYAAMWTAAQPDVWAHFFDRVPRPFRAHSLPAAA